MKLAIDIDENFYSRILEGDFYLPLGVLVAFQDGIPLEQEPCSDAVSRQAVLNILEKEGHKWGNDYRDWVDAVKDVETLPPVNPQETNVEELQKRSYLEGFHEALKMINNEKKAVYARLESEEEHETNN